jgi:hypothetical protein
MLADQGFDVAADAIRSKSCEEYNCLAWTLDVYDEIWSPTNVVPTPDGQLHELGGYFWPRDVDPLTGVSTVEKLYANRGFVRCDDPASEEGFDRVAIYSMDAAVFDHAAVQRDGQGWTSKMGPFADIEHDDPSSIADRGLIGAVRVLMKRAVSDRPPDPHEVSPAPRARLIDIPHRSRRPAPDPEADEGDLGAP